MVFFLIKKGDKCISHLYISRRHNHVKQNLLIFAIVVIVLSLFPSVVLADTGPLPPVDCGVWAYNPVRSGSNVNGKAEVSCLTNHQSLRVVAGLRDWTGRYISKTKTC